MAFVSNPPALDLVIFRKLSSQSPLDGFIKLRGLLKRIEVLL